VTGDEPPDLRGPKIGGSLEVDLTACDPEPVQRLGTVQSHGVLLVLDEPDLTICWASTNTGIHLGVEAADLLGAALADALGAGAAARLSLALHDRLAVGDDPLALHLPAGSSEEITLHRGDDGLVLVELVPAAAPDCPRCRRCSRTCSTPWAPCTAPTHPRHCGTWRARRSGASPATTG